MTFRTFVFVFTLASTSWCAGAYENFLEANQAFRAQEWERAAELYQAALDKDAMLWQAYQGLGNALYRLKRFEEAFAAYEKSLALHPENPRLVQFIQDVKRKLAAGAGGDKGRSSGGAEKARIDS